ncbi:MAG: flippase [Candidatus Magasanikbacteria bacterium]|jgi:O-antigen/teichoic acid export membrane protein|nr:flippase [Candidatus Magasanikbacteria bacterium]MBT4071530.1 flippase [Candidatus Magasanikbacteria bacterium]
MTITKKLAHNVAAQLIGKIISTLLGLLAVIMLTRYLGVEQYGWYTTVISFLGFAGILVDFGMAPLTAQMTSERPTNITDKAFKEKQIHIFHNLFTFRLITAFIFFALVPIIAWFFPYPLEVKIAISFTTISFFAISMNLVSVGLYQTRLKTHLQSIGEVIGRIVLVLGIIFMIRAQANFLPVLGIITLSNVAYALFVLYSTNKLVKLRLVYDKTVWREIIKKMWPIAISIIFNVVYLRGDTLILAHFHSQIDVGLYGAAYRVIDIVSQLAMMMMGLLLPLLAHAWSRELKTEFKKYYQQAFDVMMMLGLPIVTGTILAAKPIILLFKEEYLGAVYPLQVLSLAVLGVYFSAIYGHAAVAINRQKETIWVFASNAIITFTGYMIFIPMYGIPGAAWMTVFSELYTGVMLFFIIRHYSKTSLSLTTWWKIVISTTAMGMVVYAMQNQHIAIIIPVAMLVYALFLYITRAVKKSFIVEIFGK